MTRDILKSGVLNKDGCLQKPSQLARSQLSLFGLVARSQATDPLRKDTFALDTLEPSVGHYIRKVGRPRTNWTESMLKEGAARFGGKAAFSKCVQSSIKEQWKAHLNRIFVKPGASRS